MRRATDLFWVSPESPVPIALHHWRFDDSYRQLSHRVVQADDPDRAINAIFAGRSGVPSDEATEAKRRRFVPFPVSEPSTFSDLAYWGKHNHAKRTASSEGLTRNDFNR
jgi:hypothetical protein